MLAPWAPHSQLVRTMVEPLRTLTLAGELGRAVNGGGARLVPLPVRTVRRAVKDVVGGYVEQMCTHQCGRLGDVAGAGCVHCEGGGGLRLAQVDRSERTDVKDELGSEHGARRS